MSGIDNELRATSDPEGMLISHSCGVWANISPPKRDCDIPGTDQHHPIHDVRWSNTHSWSHPAVFISRRSYTVGVDVDLPVEDSSNSQQPSDTKKLESFHY